MRHTPSRARVVALVALLGAALTSVLGSTTPASASDATLDQLAAAHGKYFGSATDNPELTDSAYTALLGSQYGIITPGNSMKWDTIEPSQGQFNYTRGDAVVSFAAAHGQRVRGHNLVWHSQLPNWVSSLPTAQVQAAMENHITNEVTHYKGKIYAWDVVNEPFNDDGSYRTDAFTQAMGVGYIADALRTAHAADPAAKLYVNDYNIEGSGAKADAMYSLVSSLKSQGVPIDGVGFETHLATQYGFPSGMQANMQRFAALGVDVAVTELDVRMPLPSDSGKVATQNTYYANVVTACLNVPRCVGITVWDFTDKYSWVPSAFPGQGAADLLDGNLQPKAALAAVRTALGDTGTGGGDTTPPSAPTGLTVTGTTASTVGLAWTAATDNVAVTGYDVYRGTTRIASTAATTYTDTGLTAGTGYTYTVRAHDAAGNTSTASGAVTATTTGGGGGTSGCRVTYHVDNDWGAGFTATVTVTNTGTSAITAWQVAWTFAGNQTISNAWNTTEHQSGAAVTAANAGYNGTVAANGSTSFGFQAGYTGANAAPTPTCTAS